LALSASGRIFTMLKQLADWVATFIEQIIVNLGYPGIFLVMLAENLFPPIPSELVMPFAGFAVAKGNMDFTLVMIAGTAGAVVGAIVLYKIGKWADEKVVRGFLQRWGRWLTITEDELDRALSIFDKRGDSIVFLGRLIPIIRSLISIPAGMRKMPMGRFLLFTSIGSSLWNLALTTAGVWLGASWKQILDVLGTYQNVTLVVLVLAIVAFVFVRFRRARAAASA
jgi:membrane protein DedA with SNARE-associated domain